MIGWKGKSIGTPIVGKSMGLGLNPEDPGTTYENWG